MQIHYLQIIQLYMLILFEEGMTLTQYCRKELKSVENHINTIIKPALKKGKLVITDRYCDSTFVYQCYANGFGIKRGKWLHKELLNDFLPKKTFLFLLSSKEILKSSSELYKLSFDPSPTEIPLSAAFDINVLSKVTVDSIKSKPSLPELKIFEFLK